MYSFIIQSSEKYISPVFTHSELHLDCLIDTGASIPVIRINSDKLSKLNCSCKIKDASINGFGGECKGVVFSIPEFKVGELVYAPFEFFTPLNKDNYKSKSSMPPIILSASMFYNTVYEINPKQNKIVFKLNTKNDLKKSFEIEEFPKTETKKTSQESNLSEKDVDKRLRAKLDGEVLFNEPFNAPMFSVFYNQISTENINKKEELNKLRKIMLPILVNNQDIRKGLKLCQETLPNLSQDQIIKYVTNLKRKLDVKNKNLQR